MPNVRNQDKRDIDGIIGNVNENKTKKNSDLLLQKHKIDSEGWDSVRERESSFSLDFRLFRPSVIDGVRSKVDLRGEGYAWTPIWWSSDNSKR